MKSMEPYLPSLRRRLASAAEFLENLLKMIRPQVQEIRSQRMCPFCGLITARAKRFCLECGKPLRAIQTEPKDAQQG